MSIELLWVHEELRRQGIATQLMQKAEEMAKAHQCSHAYTRAWETALGFYLKQGYRIVGELIDYPAGHTYYTVRKDL